MARRVDLDNVSDLSRLTSAPSPSELFANPRGVQLVEEKYKSAAGDFCEPLPSPSILFLCLCLGWMKLMDDDALLVRENPDVRQHYIDDRPRYEERRYDNVTSSPRYDPSPGYYDPRTPTSNSRFDDRYREAYSPNREASRSYNNTPPRWHEERRPPVPSRDDEKIALLQKNYRDTLKQWKECYTRMARLEIQLRNDDARLREVGVEPDVRDE